MTRFIGPGREAFMASEELQDAVIRNVELIGPRPLPTSRRHLRSISPCMAALMNCPDGLSV